jgi:putative SOS response-associated peptidase YedK
MCGRYVSASTAEEIAQYFAAEVREVVRADPRPANFNVAPTDEVYVVRETHRARVVELARWGLVPHWAKDQSVGARLINARAETLATKPAFAPAFRRRRCIVPADGFYEWMVLPGHKRKQPMFITRADGDRFAFAGLWETWTNPLEPDAPPLRSCTIITGPANDKVAKVHDRMPVMLAPDAWATWLDRDQDDLVELQQLFVPAPSSLIEMYPVSTAVNNVRNKDASLIEPLPASRGDGHSGEPTLF